MREKIILQYVVTGGTMLSEENRKQKREKTKKIAEIKMTYEDK